MKKQFKYLVITCFLCLKMQAMMAQMNDGARFGLVAGISGSSLYDDTQADDKKKRIGYNLGVFGQFPLSKSRFSIRPELLFSTKGATFDFKNANRPKLKLSYVELPVSFQWHLIGILNLHAGMYASLLTGSSGTLEDSNGSIIDYEFDKSNFSSIDYGYQLGGGLDLGGLGLHFRVSRGLKEIAEKGSIQDYVGNLKNGSWALTLNWAF